MTNINKSDTDLREVDEQAAVVREGIKKVWGARKELAKRVKVSESTVRRHLMEGSTISDHVRLQTIAIGAMMLLEMKDEIEKIKENIQSVSSKSN